ncbi:MAG: phytanoyl-CoA dioxygenase family protein [Candidatus Latescibacterota bacterium]|jgi:ectoine hydroxylase-related dioxygenase (phytanoyl-CoA dioxygenase family)
MTANLHAFTATPADAPAEHIRRQYANDGFLLLSGLIDDETSRQASEFLVEQPGMDGDSTSIHPPDLYLAERELVEHFARQDEALLACFSDAFIDMTATLVEQSDLHRPNGVQTQNLLTASRPWTQPSPHIDGIPKQNKHKTFPGPYQIAFIIYLNDVESRGGSTIGWPGSQHKVRAKAQSDPVQYEYLHDLNKEVPGLDLGEPVELLPKRGDILFFQNLWVHGATFNIQPEPRLAIRPLCSCEACNTRWYKRDGWSFWQP